jgi:hypothetical protein
LIGISGFFRPDILLFLPFIAGIFWIHRFLHNTKPLPVIGYNIFVSLIGFGLVLIPWIVFTALRSGTVVVYSTNFIPSHLDGLSRLVGNPVSDIFRWCMSERECMSDLSNISDVIAMHFALFKEYPAHWTDLFLQKVWLPWYGSESQRWNTILALQTLVMLPAILAGIYLWSKKKGLDFALVLGLSVIGYFWLVSIAVLSINRYMPPVYPFLGMFTGFAAHVLCRTHFRLPHMRIN